MPQKRVNLKRANKSAIRKGEQSLGSQKKEKQSIMATTESLYGRFSTEAALGTQRQWPRKK